MRTLYLLRHAKSDWSDEPLDDFDRTLSPRGIRDAGRMAAFLADKKVRPDVVLCSTARRTRATLALLGLLERDSDVQYLDALYGATEAEVMAAVRATPDGYKSVMVIGHNPTLSDLIGEEMPTLALATIAVDVKKWSDAKRSTFGATSVVTPKMLRPKH